MTLDEYIAKVEEFQKRVEDGFAPLFLAVSDMQVSIVERAFDKSENTAGQSIESVPYSTEEIYVSDNVTKKSLSAYKIGKRGLPIKSGYFPKGYSEFKQFTGLPRLELSLRLRNNMFKPLIIQNKNKVSILLDDMPKIKGLEKKYGVFSQASQEEIDQLLEDLKDQLITEFNNL